MTQNEDSSKLTRFCLLCAGTGKVNMKKVSTNKTG